MPKIVQKLIYSSLLVSLFGVTSAYADNLDYNVQVRTLLNITVSSNTVSLSLNPGGRSFNSADLKVSVGTNNATGYKMYINADTTDLVNNGYDYISTLDSSVMESAFTANRWGYRISAGDSGDSNITDLTGAYFYPFSTNTLISSSSTAVNNNETTLTFASKVNYEKPLGQYTLNFSFKALPIITTYNMQNLDPGVCTSNPTLVTDSRDGQTYAVARLADGKCWMLQNLKLGTKSESLKLTSENSNVDENGFILTNKLTDGKFPSEPISDPTTGDASYYYDGSAYYCADAYGCYYNSYTATAGSMTSSTGPGVNVNYSICPARWTLPTGGNNSNYYNLAASYGRGAEPSTTVATNMLVANSSITAENVNGEYAPGLLLSGTYDGNGAYGMGEYGYYWSRTSYSLGHSHTLTINMSGVYLNHLNKSNGRAVRCLLQES